MSGQGALDEIDMEEVSNKSSSSEENLLMQTGKGLRATRTVFLILFLLIGFVGNSVLVATIAQSGRLKSTTLNLFILSVAAVNLLDSLINIPLVLGASLAEEWTYGSFVCQLNAFCIQLTSIVMVFALLMMTLDRFTSLHSLRSGSDTCMNTPRANGLIVACWTHGIALSLVILIAVISVEPFPARYLCSPSKPVNIAYICFVSIFGYIVPILLMTAMFVYIIKVCISVKIKHEGSAGKTYADGSSSVVDDRLFIEINAVKLIGALVLLWCICEGPFLLLVTVDQFQNSKQLRRFYQKNNSNSFSYPGHLDACFTWLRLSYVTVLPIVSVFWCTDVRNKLKKTFSCCSNELTTNTETSRRNRNENQNIKRESKSKPKESPVIKAESRASLRSKKSSDKEKDKEIKSRKLNEKEKEKERLSLSNGLVPVLFATANGLHYETTGMKNMQDLSDSEAYVTEPETTDTTLTQVLTSRKCDVFGSGLLAHVGEDTSDYDSQVEDPFATSTPVSVKSHGSPPEQELCQLRTTAVVEHSPVYDETTPNKRKSGKNKEQLNGAYTNVIIKNELLGKEIKAYDFDDKTSHDSGTGSIGNRKKKPEHACANDALDYENGNDIHHIDNCTEISATISPSQNQTKTKKRRKKKKRKVESLQNDCNAGQTLKENPDDLMVSHARILPKLNFQSDSTDNVVQDSSNERQSKNNRPLPDIARALPKSPDIFTKSQNSSELFGKKSTKLPYRQLSDNTGEHSAPSLNTGVQTERTYQKQYSSETPKKRVQSARPVPSPRKSLTNQHSSNDVLNRNKSESRMHLLESGVLSGDLAFEREPEDVPTAVSKARRKRGTEHHTGDV